MIKKDNIITTSERINFIEGFHLVKNRDEAIQQIKRLTLYGAYVKGNIKKIDDFIEDGTNFFTYEVNRELHDDNGIVKKDKYVFECFQNEGENVYIDEVSKYLVEE